MNVSEAIRSRRAVKSFDIQHKMTESEISDLMALVLLAPTAFNIQNWRFVLVRDPALRLKIREAAWNQPQVTEAALLVILTADLKSWEKDTRRYWRLASQATQDYMVSAIEQYYGGRDQVQRDEAMRSCGIAAQTLMLAAKEIGYDSCPMDGFDFDAVGKLINLPDDHVIAMFVAIGKAAQPAHPRSGPLAMNDAVVYDHF